MTTAIVTDSTCDIPDELVAQLDIQVMRNFIIIGGRSHEDGVEITRKEFYERLPGMKELPTTATASAGAYGELYETLFQKGATQIVSIHPSGVLSGILNAVNAAALAFDGRVHVIDSKFISMGLGYQAIQAAEAAQQGIPGEQIVQMSLDAHRKVRVVAMLDTLEYIRRSGRVSWARASLGNLLSIKLFVNVQGGKVESYGEVRTRRKGIARMLELINQLGPLERLAILHTNAEEDANQILAQVQNEPARHAHIVNVTTIIGTHVGPNALGFAAVTA